MNEILPGIYHWTAVHPNLDMEVSCHYVEPAGAILDPLTPPDEGIEWFEGRDAGRVVLSTRHHLRDAAKFAERLGVPVLVNERCADEVSGTPGLQTYAYGDEVAPGIVAHQVLESWPDETALHIAHGGGVLLIADCVMHYGEDLGFVPDQYMGDDPEGEKIEIREGLEPLLDLDFDAVLFAHGAPIPSGGKEALRAFVEAQPS